jgi:hypothetical protein
VNDIFRSLKNIVDLGQAIRHVKIKSNTQTLNKQFEVVSLKKAFELSNTLTENLIGVALPVQSSELVTNKLNNHFIDQVCSDKPRLAWDYKTILACLKNRSLLQDSPMRKLGFYLISFKQRFIQAKWIFE